MREYASRDGEELGLGKNAGGTFDLILHIS